MLSWLLEASSVVNPVSWPISGSSVVSWLVWASSVVNSVSWPDLRRQSGQNRARTSPNSWRVRASPPRSAAAPPRSHPAQRLARPPHSALAPSQQPLGLVSAIRVWRAPAPPRSPEPPRIVPRVPPALPLVPWPAFRGTFPEPATPPSASRLPQPGERLSAAMPLVRESFLAPPPRESFPACLRTRSNQTPCSSPAPPRNTPPSCTTIAPAAAPAPCGTGSRAD